MPTNKNAQLRYQILDRCFSDFNHQYSIDDLVKIVNESLYELSGSGISLRQIRDDIKYLRDRMTYDAPIKAYPLAGRKCYYRYEDPQFTIFSNVLSVKEIQKLRSTIDMLGKYRGVPSTAWLEEVISNLEIRFGIQPNNENIVAFDQNEQLKGLEFLSLLIDSAIQHHPLRILYKTYSGNERETIVHPYHLKQYNNRWFLFGLKEGHHTNYITNKALDRIVRVSPATDVTFIPNSTIDFSSYFKDIVGVTLPEDHVDVEEVILKFDATRFPYITSKPIHHSQKVLKEAEHTITLSVRPNKELEALIFSFGPQCEVLQPQWLREQVMKKMQDVVNNYVTMKIGRTDKV